MRVVELQDVWKRYQEVENAGGLSLKELLNVALKISTAAHNSALTLMGHQQWEAALHLCRFHLQSILEVLPWQCSLQHRLKTLTSASECCGALSLFEEGLQYEQQVIVLLEVLLGAWHSGTDSSPLYRNSPPSFVASKVGRVPKEVQAGRARDFRADPQYVQAVLTLCWYYSESAASADECSMLLQLYTTIVESSRRKLQAIASKCASEDKRLHEVLEEHLSILYPFVKKGFCMRISFPKNLVDRINESFPQVLDVVAQVSRTLPEETSRAEFAKSVFWLVEYSQRMPPSPL